MKSYINVFLKFTSVLKYFLKPIVYIKVVFVGRKSTTNKLALFCQKINISKITPATILHNCEIVFDNLAVAIWHRRVQRERKRVNIFEQKVLESAKYWANSDSREIVLCCDPSRSDRGQKLVLNWTRPLLCQFIQGRVAAVI